MATNGTTSFFGTFHGKTDSVYTLPAEGSSVVISPEPGAYTQFLFKIDEISNVSTRADGTLEMKMVNNSTLVIENFQDLVNSAESCGRDSILQFLADQPVAGGGAPLTKIVNIAPDALARALDPALANSNTVIVHEPAPGVTHEVMMVPGKIYQFDFDMQHTAKTMDGTNLLLSFKDGGLVILRDYVPVMNGELPPALTLADGTVVDASKMLATVCAPTDTPLQDLKAAAVPNIEPAAGEKHIAHHAAPTPQKLADIEPAAGSTSAAISGGHGGGFSSGIDPAGLNGLNPLGPLGPTELVYGIPGVTDVPTLPGSPPAVTPPNPVDGTPVIGDQTQDVDETNLAAGPLTVNGQLTHDFGSDGAGATGTIVPQGAGSFTSSGSELNGALTSNGVPVVVTLAGNTYTGMAGGEAVFTVVVNADGTYSYTQYAALDHADSSNPNDVITLNFGVIITDADGDSDNGTITINVADDAPIAHDDTALSGNVLANDTLSQDHPTLVTNVVFGGQTYTVPNGGQTTIVGSYGSLIIASDGTYTYTANGHSSGTDSYTYTIVDYDGDTSSAQINVAVAGGVPTIGNGFCPTDETDLSAGPVGVMGTYTYNYGPDGAGSIAATGMTPSGSMLNGQLTSGGVPVVVAQNGNVFTGTAGGQTVFTFTMTTDGSYTFYLYKPLDHADGSNPNDIINLDFNVRITDSNGDTADGVMHITVADDAVIAVDDVGVNSGGNVMTNDWYSNDQPMAISNVVFNGTAYTIPTGGSVTITGTSGVLVMQSNGQYTYSPTGGSGDVFTYTLRDYDGDTSQAHLSFGASQANGMPTIGNGFCPTDETDLSAGRVGVLGTYVYNYGTDGAGSIVATGMTPSGSMLNGHLTSGGQAVVVTQNGNVFTGTAGGQTVFTFTLDQGSYTFFLFKPLDHADATNPNDVINLDFNVRITDGNGDTADGVMHITVADDGVIAIDDVGVNSGGNVIANDWYSNDQPMAISQITFNNVAHDIPAGGSVTINGTSGVLVIQSNGQYTYTPTGGSGDVFTYTLRDYDGDTSQAHLSFGASQGNGTPTIGDATGQVDETALWDGLPTVTGQVAHNFGTDGAGTIAPTGMSGFSATGSLLNNHLTMSGLPVIVTQTGNTYEGHVVWPDDGSVGQVFTMTINSDGTYNFVLHNTFDHADGNNPNDVITLNFGVSITDSNGDSDTGVIKINVLDDAPVAHDDTATLDSNHTASGNLYANDHYSYDDMYLKTIVANGVTHDIPKDQQVTIPTTYGTLTIQNGQWSYVANAGASGTDVITYTVIDIDGDQSSAHLSIPVDNGIPNGVPTIGNGFCPTDETDLSAGRVGVLGTYVYNYGTDGTGHMDVTGLTPSGSMMNGQLTSGGVPVVTTQNGNVITGTAGGQTVFTFTLNGADPAHPGTGSYTFFLYKPLDHGDPAHTDTDIINLDFNVRITDANGDTANSVMHITVSDDGLIAIDDVGHTNGNVIANDWYSNDGPMSIATVTFNGVAHAIAANSSITIQGTSGTLVMESDGHYTYTATGGAGDDFVYTLRDYDGDTSQAHLTFGAVVNSVATTNGYVYSPYDAASETLGLSAASNDVVAQNSGDVHNGATVTAIDSHSVALGDQNWITSDIYVPVGVSGHSTDAIPAAHDGLRVSFDQPTNTASLTIEGDHLDTTTESFLMARVYVVGSNTPTIVSLDHATHGGQSDVVTYDLDASQFGGRAITQIDLYPANAKTTWTLADVSYDHGHVEGTDTVGHTMSDQGSDIAAAFAHATVSNVMASPADTGTITGHSDSVIAHADPVTQAIEDFVVATTYHDSLTPTPANDHHYMETPILIADTTQDLYHASAA